MKRPSRPTASSQNFFRKIEADDIFFLASGLAFNFLICFIPLLLVGLSILGYFLHSSQELMGHVRIYIENMLPQASSKLTSNILNLAKNRKLVGIIGFFGLIWASTQLFGSIRTVLDKTLNITCPYGYFKQKLTDLLLVLISGFLFLISIIFSGIIDLLRSIPERIGMVLPEVLSNQWQGRLTGIGGGYFFSVLLFFIIYRFLPSQRPTNRAAVLTAFLIGALWDGAKYLFRLYVNLLNNFTAVYGSFGLLVVFIFWIYYSSLIFVLGGEILWLQRKRK
jgi:membrane protein